MRRRHATLTSCTERRCLWPMRRLYAWRGPAASCWVQRGPKSTAQAIPRWQKHKVCSCEAARSVARCSAAGGRPRGARRMAARRGRGAAGRGAARAAPAVARPRQVHRRLPAARSSGLSAARRAPEFCRQGRPLAHPVSTGQVISYTRYYCKALTPATALGRPTPRTARVAPRPRLHPAYARLTLPASRADPAPLADRPPDLALKPNPGARLERRHRPQLAVQRVDLGAVALKLGRAGATRARAATRSRAAARRPRTHPRPPARAALVFSL